jgi:hypothetical protein
MRNTISRLTATVIILSVFWGCNSLRVDAQAPNQSELFMAVPNDWLAGATPEQSRRIEQIRRLATTQSLYLVRINQNALKNKVVRMSIPGEEVLELVKTDGEMRNQRDFTWIGKLKSEERSAATLVIRNGEITGSITSRKGLYRISPIGGGVHAVVKVNIRKFPSDEPPSSQPKNQ